MAGRSQIEMLRLTARVPRGEAGFWKIMRELDARGMFSIADVEGESNVKPGAVAQYMRKLVKGGFARVSGFRDAPARPQKLYRLCKRPAEAPRLRADGTEIGRDDRQCLWTAMRALQTFSVADVRYAASQGRKSIRTPSAQRYIAHLEDAGYLSRTGAPDGFYRLLPRMNTGPLAPSILRLDVVFDRNKKQLVGPDVHDAQEVA